MRIYFEQHAELPRRPYTHSTAPSISSRLTIGFACWFGVVDEIWASKVEIFLTDTILPDISKSFFADFLFCRLWGVIKTAARRVRSWQYMHLKAHSMRYRMNIWLPGRFEGVFGLWPSKNGSKSPFLGVPTRVFFNLLHPVWHCTLMT